MTAENTTTIALTLPLFTSMVDAVGGKHKAFVVARLKGYSNKQIEAAVGNRPGTVAFALSKLREKHGITGTSGNNWGLNLLADALGFEDDMLNLDFEELDALDIDEAYEATDA